VRNISAQKKRGVGVNYRKRGGREEMAKIKLTVRIPDAAQRARRDEYGLSREGRKEVL